MYLKCSHCGYLNPVTSQYQTFCQNCNKKLENNFPDWHVMHPDKSFDDFKALFGQTEEMDLTKKRSHRESRFFKKDANGKTKVLWGALIGFSVMLLFITIGANYGSKVFESFFFDKTSKILLNNPWQTVTPGNAGLSFSSPVNLNEYDLTLPPQIMSKIEYLKSYISDTSQPLQIAVNIERVKPPLKANLPGGANGAVNEMMNKPAVSEFTYTDSQIVVSNIPAILQTGSYLWENNLKISFKNLIIARKRTAWQMTVLYHEDDPYGGKVADSIIRTISIQQDNNKFHTFIHLPPAIHPQSCPLCPTPAIAVKQYPSDVSDLFLKAARIHNPDAHIRR